MATYTDCVPFTHTACVPVSEEEEERDGDWMEDMDQQSVAKLQACPILNTAD